MEESEEILICSLKSLGLLIQPHITSIKHLDSSSFFSISSQSIHLLLPNVDTSSLPTSLPDSMPEKVNSCTDLATFLQQLGYPFQISFHQFLYPSEEDLYKLVRFLVERLSDFSEAKKAVNFGGKGLERNTKLVSPTLSEKTAEPLVYLNDQKVKARSEGDSPVSSSSNVNVPSQEDYVGDLKTADQVEETADVSENCKCVQESISHDDLSSQLICEEESIGGQETVLPEKESVTVILDNEHPCSSHVDQLNEQIVPRKDKLEEAENQWNMDKKSLEEKKWDILESHCVGSLECQLKLQKLKEIDREMHSVNLEIRKREKECAKLEGDLEKQPKTASRRSYIQRITEITKNSRKLDTDIERILKDTRELNLESNSIEERLHRTYAVVDEKILREAKKDPVGRQAYRHLTNIHESFEKIRKQIFAADKVQREVAELEGKLSAMASRSLDKDKLQADLDAMRRENEHLEKMLLNH
ncbi:unnamed protein product [Amaranthus hypochondriacus]